MTSNFSAFVARNAANNEALVAALRLVLGADLADELIAEAGSAGQLAANIRATAAQINV